MSLFSKRSEHLTLDPREVALTIVEPTVATESGAGDRQVRWPSQPGEIGGRDDRIIGGRDNARRVHEARECVVDDRVAVEVCLQ